ncbi:MAG: hypothetical protein ACRD0P_03475, partial [Stackebrandtia sp.]
RTGVDASAIGKWRAGTVTPSIANLRLFADGLDQPRAPMFVRAGLLEAADVGVSELPLRLEEAIAQLPEARREVMWEHVQLLVLGAENAAAEAASQETQDDPGEATAS